MPDPLSSKKRKKRKRVPMLTVENLTNSLAQIELWTNAVRRALETLPPDQVLDLPDKEAGRWVGSNVAPLHVGKNCPPPD